jgi:hypothetical protein
MSHHTAIALLIVCLGIGMGGCTETRTRADRGDVPVETLFTELPVAYTNIDFVNRLNLTDETNVFTYRHYYNGGGVAIGDLNGDGRADIYFTSNQEPNRLYLNRGAWWFDDVTDASGAGGERAWSTGVSLVDINGDGRLDIYVCNSGDLDGDDRKNELFVNQGTGEDGVPRFAEQAADYNLDDAGYGTHAAFFDYDGDGDLDMYLLNNAFTDIGSFDPRQNLRMQRDALGGDKLYRNDAGSEASTSGGQFTDVTEAAGILESEIAFGLGVSVGDLNRDGWPDIYISNDFFERDYLYINQQDGTFREALTDQMRHISLSSMGADIADINNDAFPEVFVTDMLPEGDERLKTTTTFEPWGATQASLRNGYYHQITQNTLQLNNGDGTFSEIAQLAGVHATDWSWGALFADFDLDGAKDLFVSNGIRRDLTDQDALSDLASGETIRKLTQGGSVDFMQLLERIPETRLENDLFRNDGAPGSGLSPQKRRSGQALTFTNVTADWGLDTPSFSNGAAYGDLDNDGDLDLVVNNLDHQAFIYRNEADTLLDRNYLRIELRGPAGNRLGVGTQLIVQADTQTIYLEQVPTRGFQSTVDPVLTAGVGTVDTLEAVTVRWPDGRVQQLPDVPANQQLTVRHAEAASPDAETSVLPAPPGPQRFTDVTDDVALDYRHEENAFVDFEREPLIPKKVSTEGPRAAAGDVNGDGRMDVFLGGAKQSAGALYVQQANGRFEATNTALFREDRLAEDVDATFFDADGDGDLDLYVVSGGNAYSPQSTALQDRLYLNDGSGRFEKALQRLPRMITSGASVSAADYDGDGDVDLFVGGRIVPWRYGLHPRSYLLQNDGTGHFSDVTEQVAPELTQIGMVTDATWSDVDSNGRPDLFVVGDWMPITVLRNAGNGLEPIDLPSLANSHGWWTRIIAADFDADGDDDYVVGNWGHNTRLKATPDAPVTMHVGDFDRNGYVEQIVSYPKDGGRYPLPLRGPLVRQLPYLQEQLPTHESYAGRPVRDLFSQRQLERVSRKTVYQNSTSYLENNGDGTVALRALPIEAQLAPMFGILPDDVDGDGHLDLLLAGNFFGVQSNLGRLDASYGTWLRGDGTGRFSAVPARESGFRVSGQARDIARLDVHGQDPLVMVVKNNDRLQFFRVNK